MSFEPERDQFFQYATFATIGVTVVVCLCYALLFLNPRVNPFEALRPFTATPSQGTVELPATWTHTATYTPSNTPTTVPTRTYTYTPTITPTKTLTPTATSTRTPLPTATPRPITPAPTARPVTRAPTTTSTPATAYEFVQVRPPSQSPNCQVAFVAGFISAKAGARLNGVGVRVWAFGQHQGDAMTGGASVPDGYWEFRFAPQSDVQGEVAAINNDDSQRSAKYPFHLTANCDAKGVNQIVFDWVAAK